MIKSMTGFSRSVVNHSDLTITLEIRSLNHRFLDIITRLPRGFNNFDIHIKNYIKNVIHRGRIEISINLEHIGDDVPLFTVDYNLAKQYFLCLNKLREELGIKDEVVLQDILRSGDIIKLKEDFLEEKMWPGIQNALDIGLEKLKDMRSREGLLLSNDITARLESIANHLQIISKRIPLSLDQYRSYLQQRIKSVFNIELPDERLEQELVIYAEKSDITEEMVRINSHIQQMKNFLRAEGPVGRKMDFLVQELFREANTLGAKTFDIPITNCVLEIKTELEKIREQIQNIE